MAVVTMQAKGQMTVPASIREALGIEQGTELFVAQTGPDAFACRVIPKATGIRAFIEDHTGPEPAPTPEEVQEIVRAGILAEASAEEGWEGDARDG